MSEFWTERRHEFGCTYYDGPNGLRRKMREDGGETIIRYQGADLCAPAIDTPDPGFWPPAAVVARWKADAAQVRRELFASKEPTPEERAAHHWGEKKGGAK